MSVSFEQNCLRFIKQVILLPQILKLVSYNYPFMLKLSNTKICVARIKLRLFLFPLRWKSWKSCLQPTHLLVCVSGGKRTRLRCVMTRVGFPDLTSIIYSVVVTIFIFCKNSICYKRLSFLLKFIFSSILNMLQFFNHLYNVRLSCYRHSICTS